MPTTDMITTDMITTDTITTDSPSTAARVTGRSSEFGAATAVGRRHTVNEDALLTGPGWFVVADGMGGHRAGDVASTLAVDAIAGFTSIPASTDPSTIDRLIERVVARANSVVHREATGPRAGMGTTIVGAVLLDDGSAAVFHVGDSRCYHYCDGSMSLLTTDHTLVQELVDVGHITPERVDDHPMRHVLTRAVGIGPEVSPVVVRVAAPTGRLLLCSDGVSAHVRHADLERILATVDDPQRAADELVAAALAAAGRDDASAIVIDPIAA
ncbi:MAG: hypothetical protein RLZZ01_2660 [Actinomycetota bacterium]